jgi:hypothetical protein
MNKVTAELAEALNRAVYIIEFEMMPINNHPDPKAIHDCLKDFREVLYKAGEVQQLRINETLAPLKRTKSGYTFEDFEDQERIKRERIITEVSGRVHGDGIEWHQVHEAMIVYAASQQLK